MQSPLQSPFRRILAGLIFMGLTIVSAVVGYWWLGCAPLDAVYMVVITIFGIGYGEFCPVSSATRIFTILVIFAGAIAVSLILGGFVQMVTEGEIRQVLEHRRKTQDLANLDQHTIICGFGRIRQVLSHNLAAEKQAFIVIDTSDDRITLAEAMGYRVYQGNATDEQTLLEVGIERAKSLATVLPDDATNVFITLTARGLNPQLMIVARGELASTEKKLRLAGADHVVLPANISGQRIANLITHPNTIEFLDQGEERTRLNELLTQIDVQVDELSITANSPLVGRTIADLEVRGQGAFIVVALKRHNQITNRPDPNLRLHADDTLIVLGHRGDIPRFAQRYDVKQLRYRGARW